MTRKEAKEYKARYSQAVAEGRVVRVTFMDEFGREQIMATTFHTRELALEDLKRRANGCYTSATIIGRK